MLPVACTEDIRELSLDLALFLEPPKRTRPQERPLEGISSGEGCQDDTNGSTPGSKLTLWFSGIVGAAVPVLCPYHSGGRSVVQGVLGLRCRGERRRGVSIAGTRLRTGRSAKSRARVNLLEPSCGKNLRSFKAFFGAGGASVGFEVLLAEDTLGFRRILGGIARVTCVF